MSSSTVKLVPELLATMEPRVESAVYYPADVEHLWNLLKEVNVDRSTAFLILIAFDLQALSSNTADMLATLAGDILRRSARGACCIVDTGGAGDEPDGHSSRITEEILKRVSEVSGHRDCCIRPRSALAADKSPSAFLAQRVAETSLTKRSGPKEKGASRPSGPENLEQVAASLLDLLESEGHPRFLCTCTVHGESRSFEPASLWEADVLEGLEDRCLIGIKTRLSAADLGGGTRGLEAFWTVRVAAEGRSLPVWCPYDEVEHFLDFGWDRFRARQREAAERVGMLLARYSLSEISDVGCGSGEVLAGIRAHLEASDILPSLFACDPAARQVFLAHKNLGANVRVEKGGLDCVRIENPNGSLVMMLGNTLAHIGGEEFWRWLTLGSGERPEFLLIDFAAQWRELLHQAEPEIVCGTLRSFVGEKGKVYCHMSTAGGPGWVKRGVVLQFEGGSDGAPAVNTIPAEEHRMFTKQYADPPETYFNILKARGYELEYRGEYRSGWGDHELFLYKRVAHEGEFPWPRPQRTSDLLINDRWYRALVDAWQSLSEPKGSERMEFYPAAILPFGNDHVLARYIPRSAAESEGAVADLFNAWMWVVDPRFQELKHEGAAKTEEVLPYAPSFYKVLLSDAPAGVMEHFDKTQRELRIDSNASDLELTHLEKKWLKAEKLESDGVYYAIPIYLGGLPAYVIVVRAQDLAADAKALGSALYQEEFRLRRDLGFVAEKESWKKLVGDWLEKDGLAKEFLADVFERVEGRPWKNWLELRPGLVVQKDHAEAKKEFAELKEYHGECLGESNAGDGEGGRLMTGDYYNFGGAQIGAASFGQMGGLVQCGELRFHGGKFIQELDEISKAASLEGVDEGTKEVVEEAAKEARSGNWQRAKELLAAAGTRIADLATKVGAEVVLKMLEE